MTVPISGPSYLSDRTAVLTGTAGAVGRETCTTLAGEGADVITTGIIDDGLDDIAELVTSHGSGCTTVVADVTDPDDSSKPRRTALAEAVVFLTTQQSNRITGPVVNVTGGVRIDG